MIYSLRKSKKILFHVAALYRRKKRRLPVLQAQEIGVLLWALQGAIVDKDRSRASSLAHQAAKLTHHELRKNLWEKLRDLGLALAVALVAATLIRQVWFELYEIPSGSMRPTLKEQDLLVVSKTDFGINFPLKPQHIYFDPALCQRGGIVVFTGEGMNIRDPDTVYFYVFPGKKQYVKRMIGKPGDVLYFYGGQIYGIDSDGKDISSQLQQKRLQAIEHIPFIRFEGSVSARCFSLGDLSPSVTLHQMGQSIAKLYQSGYRGAKGELLPPFNVQVSDYSALWGIGNFAMARLLTQDQLRAFKPFKSEEIGEGLLYLELSHNPSLQNLVLVTDQQDHIWPMLNLSTSVIPLNEEHLRTLFNSMYTARFFVKNGFLIRYEPGGGKGMQTYFLPSLPDVPDGCYEFYYGKAYAVKWGGITQELPADHPLYLFTPERMQLWFNLGIVFDTRVASQVQDQQVVPHRYAYFREGSLYVLGAPLLAPGTQALDQFIAQEKKRAMADPGYVPFIDRGPPVKSDGSLDTDKVRRCGIAVPPKMYLVLGDNHAMSSDSREFGFVPEGNLRGGPELIFWPPGSRWGMPNQHPYPWFTTPRLVVWALAAASFGIWWIVHRRRTRLPLTL